MKPFETDKINDMADVFYAVIGGQPDDLSEIKDFLKNNKLNQLLNAIDIENILKYDGFFADETVDAVYALLPVKLKLNQNKKLILTPQAFRKLNTATMNKPNCRVINVNFQKAMKIYLFDFKPKFQKVKEAVETLQQKIKEEKRQQELQAQQTQQLPQTTATSTKTPAQEAILKARAEKERQQSKIKINTLQDIIKSDKKKQALEERKNTPLEQLAPKIRKKEAARRRTAAARAIAPQRTSNNRKMTELTPEEQEARREANRRRNAVYRERHRAELRAAHNLRRAKLKQENPELLKAMDKKNNSSASRKKAGQTYYIMHKEKLDKQNKNNPNRAAINKKYETKQRLKKTGPVISALLQGLIFAKER